MIAAVLAGASGLGHVEAGFVKEDVWHAKKQQHAFGFTLSIQVFNSAFGILNLGISSIHAV